MTKKAGKHRGRPVVDAADRRDRHVRVLTTKTEHKELREAAASVSMSISAWMRALALKHARTMGVRTEKKRAKSPAPSM